MEHQKIITLLDNTSINHLNLEQKIGLKCMMNQEEHTMPIVTLNLKQQCKSQAYVITVMHIYLVKEG